MFQYSYSYFDVLIIFKRVSLLISDTNINIVKCTYTIALKIKNGNVMKLRYEIMN